MRYHAFIIMIVASMPCLSGQDVAEKHNEDLSLSIRGISFIRNNEYFNPITHDDFILTGSLPGRVDKSKWIEGYTLTGFFIQPELVYKTGEKFTVSGGVHILKYSGLDNPSVFKPVLSASLKLSENTTLTLGSLTGSDKHRMFDPHFNKERIYYSNVEEGMLLATENEHFFNHAWLDWENYVFRNDTTREIFTFGESFRYISPEFNRFSIEIPVQLQFKHFGGQISNYQEHVTTFFSLAAGAGVNYSIDTEGTFEAGVEYIHFRNSVIPGREFDIVNRGYASWLSMHISRKRLTITPSYWKAHDFYAPNGNGIYMSVFDFNSDYIIHDREILATNIEYKFLPASFVELFFGIELFYDIIDERMDHAMTLHLRFDKLFDL